MDGELTPRTPETLFNEALIDILIPNLGKLDVTPSGQFVLATTSRDFAFYDEGLRIYVHVRLPVDTPEGATEPIISSTFANTLFSQFDIHIEASVADPNMAAASTYSGSPQQTPAAYRLPSRPPSTAPGSSVPTSPRLAAAQLHKRDSPKGPMENVPFYAHTYNPKIKDIEAIIFRWEGAWSCLYPLTIPIVYVKSRITSPVLLLIASVSYRPLPASAASNASTSDVLNEYDTDIFDTVNLLEGLSDDLAFNIPAAPPSLPIQRFPSDFRTRDQRKSDSPNQQSAGTSTQLLTQRRNVRRVLPLRSALNVKMRSTNVSMIDKVLMMSIELENDDAGCPFLIESLDVQVASAYVTLALEGKPGLEQFPIRLNNSDQISFLYNVSLLEDGASGKPSAVQQSPPGRNQIRRNSPQNQSPQPLINPDTERLGPQRVSIVAHGAPEIHGVIAPPMQSRWNTVLEVTGLRNREHKEPPLYDPRVSTVYAANTQQMATISSKLNTPRPMSVSVSPGAGVRSLGSPGQVLGSEATKKRQVIAMPSVLARDGIHGARRAPETEVADGIVVSFSVVTPVIVGRIFSLQIFIVNRTKHTRRFMVVVPNRKRVSSDTMGAGPGMGIMKNTLPPLPFTGELEPFMEETEFLRRYFENENHEADIVCLENNVRLSPLMPITCQTVEVRFLPIMEGLHTIDLILLVDQDTGFAVNLRNVLEIFVEPDTRR